MIGPDEPIPAWLDPTQSTDYEGELAVVIGPGGRGIARAEAMRHVYGYTIVNDVTSRVLQVDLAECTRGEQPSRHLRCAHRVDVSPIKERGQHAVRGAGSE